MITTPQIILYLINISFIYFSQNGSNCGYVGNLRKTVHIVANQNRNRLNLSVTKYYPLDSVKTKHISPHHGQTVKKKFGGPDRLQGRPQDLGGGGGAKNFFLQICEFLRDMLKFF